MNTRIVFRTLTSSELTFKDSTVTFDGGMAVVWAKGEKVFAIPTENVVAIESINPPPAPIEAPKDEQAPAS